MMLGEIVFALPVAVTFWLGVVIVIPFTSIFSVVLVAIDAVSIVVILEVVIVSVAVLVTSTLDVFVVRDVSPSTVPASLAAFRVVSPVVSIDRALLASSLFTISETLYILLPERSAFVNTL